MLEPRQSDWDVLYNSQDGFDENNIRNLADDGDRFQMQMQSANENLFDQFIYREEGSGVSQGSNSFRLLSSAYSFGTQTPRNDEDAVVCPKVKKTAKTFEAYILS